MPPNLVIKLPNVHMEVGGPVTYIYGRGFQHFMHFEICRNFDMEQILMKGTYPEVVWTTLKYMHEKS